MVLSRRPRPLWWRLTIGPAWTHRHDLRTLAYAAATATSTNARKTAAASIAAATVTLARRQRHAPSAATTPVRASLAAAGIVSGAAAAAAWSAGHHARNQQHAWRPAFPVRHATRTRIPADHDLRLVSANVLTLNEHAGTAARTLVADWNPDVIVIVEDHGTAARSLDPFFTDLAADGWTITPRLRETSSRRAPGDVTIATRLPVRSQTIVPIGTTRRWPTLTVTTDAGVDVNVIGVHTTAPTSTHQTSSAATRPATGTLATEVRHLAHWIANQTRPVICAGDFNAALTAPAMQPLAGHVTAARTGLAGWRNGAGTWTPATGTVPALLDLDHHLNSGTAATAAATTPITGSDHRAVISDHAVSTDDAAVTAQNTPNRAQMTRTTLMFPHPLTRRNHRISHPMH